MTLDVISHEVSRYAIIFGASSYPDHPQLIPKSSFAVSANAFKDYLLDARGMALPDANLLWLFDSIDGNREQLLAINNFITEANRTRVSEATDHGKGVARLHELIIFYVGHGAYWSRDDFYLTPKSVSHGREAVTSIRFSDLADIVNSFAGRRYIILDCCFAAAAARHLQGGQPARKFGRYAESHFPKSGTTLLAASSQETPAEAPEALQYTMFSDGLIKALTGHLNWPETGFYSMRMLHERITEYIDFEHASRGVLPEIHSPKQEKGDISTIPVFPVLKPNDHLDTAIERQMQALHDRIDHVLNLIERRDVEDLENDSSTLEKSRRGLKALWPLLCSLLIVSITCSILFVQIYTSRFLKQQLTAGASQIGAMPLIAIQTDYGSKSYYMGALMGVIYKRNPQARIQVITSEIDSFDRLDAAWTLWQASRHYPEGTIFVVITNPGGLTSSPPTVVTTKNGFIFVGHDNGCFDLVVQHYGHKASYPISSPDLSPTQFKDGGLDYFGPTAAALSLGFPLEKVGPKTTEYIPKLPEVKHSVSADKIVGTIMAVDKFGNANTNILEEETRVAELRYGESIDLTFGTTKLKIPFQDTYSRVAIGQPVAIINDGQLQLAVREGSFADKFKVKRGMSLALDIVKP
jgi:hypothetical protein